MAVKKMCPRCRRVIEITQKRCVDCTARTNRDYDKTRRDKNSKAFYSSKPWLKTREKVLNNFAGLDLYELVVNKRIVYADTVHHIEELKENPSRALDINNLIPLSSETHSMIHKMYKTNKKQVQNELIYILKCIKEHGLGVEP